MYKILETKELAANIFYMVVEAKRVAKNCKPGQFVIVRTDEQAERIPLTICDYDREKGTVTIVFQIVGAATQMMSALKAGDTFHDFVGPLGCASEFVNEDLETLKQKKMLFVAGGVGTAPVYPQVKWLHSQGIEAECVIGARDSSLIILEDEMRQVGRVHITTDNGSRGFHGNINDCIRNLIEEEHKEYDLVIAIGPLVMMKYVCLLTKEYKIPTIVSMNPIMVDGTGMCGACRVLVGDEVKFACVDGPEFDGHLIDFDQAMKRAAMYKTEEGRRLLAYQEGDTHHGGCGNCGGDK